MQHAAPPTPRLSGHALARMVIERRMAGRSIFHTAQDLGAPMTTVHHLVYACCCADMDLATLTDRSRVRDCLCCGRPILSQHAGHRLCRPCSEGAAP